MLTPTFARMDERFMVGSRFSGVHGMRDAQLALRLGARGRGHDQHRSTAASRSDARILIGGLLTPRP